MLSLYSIELNCIEFLERVFINYLEKRKKGIRLTLTSKIDKNNRILLNGFCHE